MMRVCGWESIDLRFGLKFCFGSGILVVIGKEIKSKFFLLCLHPKFEFVDCSS